MFGEASAKPLPRQADMYLAYTSYNLQPIRVDFAVRLLTANQQKRTLGAYTVADLVKEVRLHIGLRYLERDAALNVIVKIGRNDTLSTLIGQGDLPLVIMARTDRGTNSSSCPCNVVCEPRVVEFT
jgi:hypothetical protein